MRLEEMFVCLYNNFVATYQEYVKEKNKLIKSKKKISLLENQLNHYSFELQLLMNLFNLSKMDKLPIKLHQSKRALTLKAKGMNYDLYNKYIKYDTLSQMLEVFYDSMLNEMRAKKDA